MPTLLQATSLTFAYGIRPAVDNVSLAIAPGEFAAILGPNGSGKSTLLKLLLGQLHGSGDVTWDGAPLKQLRPRDLARRVAYLPQNPAYDPDQTVADAVRLGRAPYWGAFGVESPNDIAVTQTVLATLDLTDLADRCMDTLSGGQRQRVFLGRCLAQQPAAMLLDEPNTFLDLRHQVELCRLLQTLARDQRIAILMASHDLNLAAAFADRLMLLHDGALAADGTPSQVLHPELLEKVYGIPIQRIDMPGQAPIVLPRI